jgi:cellulase/cellobiase CelA1
VRGTVVDKSENPVNSAIVYLKNTHTQDIVTHLSDSDGKFRFSGLDLNVDYDIHAERDGWASSSHSVSSFDTRKDFVVTLKLDRKKNRK